MLDPLLALSLEIYNQKAEKKYGYIFLVQLITT